jgi:hypothetical protein
VINFLARSIPYISFSATPKIYYIWLLYGVVKLQDILYSTLSKCGIRWGEVSGGEGRYGTGGRQVLVTALKIQEADPRLRLERGS